MLIGIIILQLIGLVILLVIMQKQAGRDAQSPDLRPEFEQLKALMELSDRNLKDDLHRTRTELMSITQQNRDELRTSIGQLSQTLNKDAGKGREELANSFTSFSQSISNRFQDMNSTQLSQYETLKSTIESKLNQIQANNEIKLEQMRQTVDEKLHDTLEKRLGESFKQVSDRLEQVHKGLGEMQSLANGVGDLKRVLTNVKTRGVMGEIQLGNLLEQILTPEQYVTNFKPNSRRDEIVEFAVRLPGKDDLNESVYLPIDAKFPVEDYHRLCSAYEQGDLAAIDSSQKAMIRRIKECARDIRDKYLNPPQTTDFALLFLPFEGLYAEVLRSEGTFEQVQRDYHVIIVGPTTIAAIMNSLQLGFRTLAIEKRSSEVWKLLSAIKQEFGKFGDVLMLTQKKLKQAGDVIEKASHRSRQIQRHLNKVQELPLEENKLILEFEEPLLEEEEEDTEE